MLLKQGFSVRQFGQFAPRLALWYTCLSSALGALELCTPFAGQGQTGSVLHSPQRGVLAGSEGRTNNAFRRYKETLWQLLQ